MLDENTDKLLRNTSMAKKKEVNTLNIGSWLFVLCFISDWSLALLVKHLDGKEEGGEEVE